jgi:hypothetical protein
MVDGVRRDQGNRYFGLAAVHIPCNVAGKRVILIKPLRSQVPYGDKPVFNTESASSWNEL